MSALRKSSGTNSANALQCCGVWLSRAAGRGSQGKALARKFGLEYVATGPMLDAEIKEGTETGKKITAHV
jgi:hypothetical protein